MAASRDKNKIRKRGKDRKEDGEREKERRNTNDKSEEAITYCHSAEPTHCPVQGRHEAFGGAVVSAVVARDQQRVQLKHMIDIMLVFRLVLGLE